MIELLEEQPENGLSKIATYGTRIRTDKGKTLCSKEIMIAVEKVADGIPDVSAAYVEFRKIGKTSPIYVQVTLYKLPMV
jgi:hypothetical protein